MNETLNDFRDVMALWPSRGAIAKDLSALSGANVSRGVVNEWHRINSIPPRWFDPLIRAAIKRDINVLNKELLLAMHERRVAEGPPADAKKKCCEGVEA